MTLLKFVRYAPEGTPWLEIYDEDVQVHQKTAARHDYTFQEGDIAEVVNKFIVFLISMFKKPCCLTQYKRSDLYSIARFLNPVLYRHFAVLLLIPG